MSGRVCEYYWFVLDDEGRARLDRGGRFGGFGRRPRLRDLMVKTPCARPGVREVVEGKRWSELPERTWWVCEECARSLEMLNELHRLGREDPGALWGPDGDDPDFTTGPREATG